MSTLAGWLVAAHTRTHSLSRLGGEVFTAVDFGAGWWKLDDAFAAQAALNRPDKSPPIVTEYYSGWLTHWWVSPYSYTVVALNSHTGEDIHQQH